MPLLAKNRAALEGLRVFRVMQHADFGGSLADATEEESDTFARALQVARRGRRRLESYFS